MGALIKIGYIDDDRMGTQGATAWFGRTGDIEVTTTARCVEDYLAEPVLPEIVILDLNLQNFTDPADNVAQLVAAGLKVIICSAIPKERHQVVAVTEAGAITYVTKDNDLDALADLIRAVDVGEDVTTAEHAFYLSRDDRPGRPQLSKREQEVLVAYASGDKMEAVARKLGIAKSTVQTHLVRVKVKYSEAGRPIQHRGEYSERLREDGFGRERFGRPPTES